MSLLYAETEHVTWDGSVTHCVVALLAALLLLVSFAECCTREPEAAVAVRITTA